MLCLPWGIFARTQWVNVSEGLQTIVIIVIMIPLCSAAHHPELRNVSYHHPNWIDFLIFCIPDALTFGVVSLERPTLISELIPRGSKRLPGKHWLWYRNQPIRSSHPNHQTLTQANILHQPWARCWTTRDHPITPKLTQCLALLNPVLTQHIFPVSTIPPPEKPNKGSGLCCPLLFYLTTLVLSHTALRGELCLLFLYLFPSRRSFSCLLSYNTWLKQIPSWVLNALSFFELFS